MTNETTASRAYAPRFEPLYHDQLALLMSKAKDLGGAHVVLLWLYLDKLAGQNRSAWPGNRHLADAFGWPGTAGLRKVERAMERLRAAGLITCHTHGFPARRTITVHNLPQKAVAIAEPPPGVGTEPPRGGGAEPPRGGGVKETQGKETQLKDTSSQAAPAGQLLLEPQERGVPPWELLRQQVVVEHGRESASRWVPSKGLGKQLGLILRRTGSLEAAQRLLRLAYTSQEFVHQRNRERGGGHPPLDTLARHGVRYLEAAVDWQPPRLAGEYQRPADTPPPRELTEAEWEAEMADWDAWAAKRGA